jgi:hypothetical protein
VLRVSSQRSLLLLLLQLQLVVGCGVWGSVAAFPVDKTHSHRPAGVPIVSLTRAPAQLVGETYFWVLCVIAGVCSSWVFPRARASAQALERDFPLN